MPARESDLKREISVVVVQHAFLGIPVSHHITPCSAIIQHEFMYRRFVGMSMDQSVDEGAQGRCAVVRQDAKGGVCLPSGEALAIPVAKRSAPGEAPQEAGGVTDPGLNTPYSRITFSTCC